VPDEDERLELRRVPLDEALAMVERGEVSDAKSLVGILLLDRLRREGRLPELGALPVGEATAPPAPAAQPPDPDAIHVRYGYTPVEFALANAAFMRRQLSSQIVGWGSIAATALNLATFQDPFLAVVTGLLGLAFLTGLFVAPFIWWAFRRKAAALSAIELTIDRTGVASGAVFGAGTVAWDGIEKIERSGRWYFVRSVAGMAFPIPERVLGPDDLARFRRHAARHGLTLDGHRVDTAAR
jgi:hypothetical protein